MKDTWYGDNRDLVKWGVLIRLAEKYGASRVLQVAYYRCSAWQPVEMDGREQPMPEGVIRHFRNSRDITRLTSNDSQSIHIDLIDSLFADRELYMQEILAKVRASRDSTTTIILLDPDTGLECSKPTLKHVLESELAQIWAAMRSGDVLVLYQHQTNRNGTPWVDPKRVQFERALGIEAGAAKTALGKAAHDVVFFFVQKSA